MSAPVASVDLMQLTATIRPLPHARTDDSEPAMDVVTAEAADYVAARTELERRLPRGWQLMSLRSH